MSDDVEQLAAKRVCAACVREEFLREDVRKNGEIAVCDYCYEEEEKTIAVEELADRVEAAFEDHFQLTRSEPNSLEWAMMKDEETNYEWEQAGEPVLHAIANAAEIEEDVAQDVLEILQERHYDRDLAEIGESGPYDDEQHYEEKGPNDIELRQDWQRFEAHLKSEARFFSAYAQGVLDRIFGDIANYKKRDGTSVIIDAGPDTPVKTLYRARVFQSQDELAKSLPRPDLNVGPPPFHSATAGRMNAHGISMFYGATSEGMALGEVRPPVGSEVYVVQFEIIRPLKLLDVAALKSVFVSGSVFDPRHIGQLERAKFLERVSDRITQPVMPDHQPFEYLITQVIADYLASKVDPNLDGLAYPSAQVQDEGFNVALFHKSSRVEEMLLPAGIELSADCWGSDEDGPYPEYTVIEETPPEENAKHTEAEKAEHAELANFGDFAVPHDNTPVDLRDATLRVVLGSETVHRIMSVQIASAANKVRRYRWAKGGQNF
jgi:hypothetical protein